MTPEQISEVMSVFCKLLCAKANGDLLSCNGKVINAIEIKNDGTCEVGESLLGTVYGATKKFMVLTRKEENNDDE